MNFSLGIFLTFFEECNRGIFTTLSNTYDGDINLCHGLKYVFVEGALKKFVFVILDEAQQLFLC